MSNGQNTQNVTTAIGILAQLLVQAGTLATTIQTAQANGTDITDEQLDMFVKGDASARASLQADIDAARQNSGSSST